ncbi:MAG: gamma-glutamylcyclotransferase [Alphaproteobacteria bacterium]|nr:gamma-glutamylcyclotransferase [Alphaproteobacteria bacterium]
MSEGLSANDLARRKQAFLDSIAVDSDIRVFAYGSLMWNPGFEHAGSQTALLHGWHRSFCVYSHRYRGTPDRPGLVLGLDRGGSCRGIVYRVARARARDTLAYLWDREMVLGVYRPRLVYPRFEGERIACHAFTVDRRHRQYAGGLAMDEMVRLIRQGVGKGGHNRDYLAHTVSHLDFLGITDGPLHRLHALVEGRIQARP